MDQIAQLIADFKNLRWDSHPFERALQIALESPEHVCIFINAVVDEIPEGGTFHDVAMSFLPMGEWPLVVEHALATLENQPHHEAAAAVIDYAGLQCVASLHPHLTKIFQLAIRADWRNARNPWRDSGLSNFDFLASIVGGPDATAARRAWCRLLETRHPKALDFAVDNVDRIDLNWRRREYGLPETLTLNDYLAEVGYHQLGAQRTCLFLEQPWHIVLPADYYPTHPVLATQLGQATWTTNGPSLGTVSIGGSGTANCGRCGGRRHMLIQFGSAAASLGISNVKELAIETCLSCLGWEEPIMFYRHNADGAASCLSPANSTPPQFPVGPLEPSTAVLVNHGPRWRWQEWGLSNSRENLNRVGGHPSWVQGAEYPVCPECHTKMRFLLQLDSNFRTTKNGQWLWGSGGLAYIFWCDSCRVSGLFWQCT